MRQTPVPSSSSPAPAWPCHCFPATVSLPSSKEGLEGACFLGCGGGRLRFLSLSGGSNDQMLHPKELCCQVLQRARSRLACSEEMLAHVLQMSKGLLSMMEAFQGVDPPRALQDMDVFPQGDSALGMYCPSPPG